MSAQEKSDECDSCGFTTKDLEHYEARSRTSGDGKWLCVLCAPTAAGTALEYPRQYEGQTAILATVCYIGNVIIAAIKAKTP